LRRHTVGPLFVPIEQSIAPEPLLEALEGGAHTNIIRPFVTKATHQQERSIESVSIELAHIAA